ncbi:Amine acid ABC transporter, permease protein, 3-TM region, His/Glu/Gln/Arg/opine family [Mesorhizobium plurifarium]|uniref:Glutamate/aspartate import permease protein GltK n=1 Tax=Mesorhizobium plurifarium TaxID=69974 RepID=A0A0K2VXQ3_MESPL|nr:Amine acid ABC transporter, permease protein, 3-TM region, His/Glu/Gln/Arg/opine family [Mesorhizobium plurifarium]
MRRSSSAVVLTLAVETPPSRVEAPPGPLIRRRPGARILSTVVAVAALVVVLALAGIVVGSGSIHWDVIGEYFFAPVVLRGVATTLMLTVVSLAGSAVLGTLLAAMRISKNPVLRVIAAGYIWFFRGTPLLVQIVFWFNLGLFLPRLSVAGFAVSTNTLVTPTTAALLGLFLNVSAFMCEVIRGGLLAVDTGQTEAALSIGMTPRRALLRIVLPQAIRVILPAAGNLAIDLLKATSLVYVIGTKEILGTVQGIAAQNFYVIEMLIVASLWYLVLVSIASAGQSWLEARLARGVGSGAHPMPRQNL